jgi:hypothetical protein
MRRSSKLPKDPNQLAAEIIRLSTDEGGQHKNQLTSSSISAYLSKIGREGGLKGGKARAEKLSAKKRIQIAKKAAQIRWSKKPS